MRYVVCSSGFYVALRTMHTMSLCVTCCALVFLQGRTYAHRCVEHEDAMLLVLPALERSRRF